MSKTTREFLEHLGFGQEAIDKFEKRRADVNTKENDGAQHASSTLRAALEKYVTAPDAQSLGNLLILTGEAVSHEELCNDCLYTIHQAIADTEGKRALAELIGVPFAAIKEVRAV